MEDEICLLSNPLTDEILKNILDISRSGVLNWCSILFKIGIDEEDQKEWITIFKKEVSSLYKKMIEEVTVHQNRLFVEIETLLQKSEMLCKDLRIKMPEYGSKGLSLYEERRLLKERIQRYEGMVKEIHEEILSLNKKEVKLCHALGRTPKTIPESPLPTAQFIEEFEIYLESLEKEKYTREENFFEMKTSILEIVKELNFKPSLNFEKAVITSDDSLIAVTDNNMSQLYNFHESLKQQLQETKQEIATLRERIRYLWELLAEDVKDCDAFLQHHTGNSLNTLAALQQEVRRCEDLKKANIEVFVKRFRKNLVTLWEKCHFTDEERDFEYLHSDLYTEDLLSLHDLEIQKLNTHYTQNSEIFNLLERREDLWNKWLILEQRANDPSRYNNRGGQLLKEEKERNILLKRIPQIEEQLLQLSREFEKRTGKQFLSWGDTIDTIISRSRQNYDTEKKLKLSAHKQKREKTPTPAKSPLCMRSTQNLAVFGGNASSAKRKPVKSLFPAKRMCLRNEENENVPQSAPPKLTVNGLPLDPSRYSLERAKRIKKCRTISQRMMQKRLEKQNIPNSTEYDMFEHEIQNKEGCRSTIFMAAGGSNTPLALPLPSTPHRVPAAKNSTHTSKSHTPRTATKLKLHQA